MSQPAADSELESLEDLEWQRLVDHVVGRCRGPRGKLASLPLARSFESARTSLAETDEALRLLVEGDPLPVDAGVDLRQSLARVDRMGTLDAGALRDLVRMLAAGKTLRRFLGARRERLPALSAACALDPSLDRLEEELRAHIDEDGTLSDHASPELRRLRTETANLRARIVGRLDELVHRHASVLSDSFHTMRDGRYVLPVRTDSHEKLPGIVHGTSGSGATVFIEPEAVIVAGNRLKMALAEQEREEERILSLLTELVRERLASVVAAVDAIDHADLRAAMARFGVDLRARVVPLLREPHIDLREARHPLLALDGVTVVPNDLVLDGGTALVVSGPNAGGKTVALKLLGLAALMVRAGLPLPVAEGSAIGFFDVVLSDVGDDQSLTKNLSTFSAHVRRLVCVLGEARVGALVLLDELAGGTDPEEGAALACAVVDALCRAGAATAVTTHYEPLKAMATRDERLRNASVGFDVERMEPTFTLAMGIPGASSALAVARRFGMPAPVLEYAHGVLPEHSKNFDELVRKLESRMHEVATMRAAADEERRDAAARGAELTRKLEQLERGEREKLGRETSKLLEQVRRARDELREARKSIRAARDEASLEVARRSVESLAVAAQQSRQALEIREGRGAAEAALRIEVGARLFVPRLGREVEVLELPDRGRVKVAAGPLKMQVGLEDLRAADAPERPAPPSSSVDAPRTGPAMPTRENTIDLRGMRVEDALALMESFLDRVYGANEAHAFILHGVGTGALRDAVREALGRSTRYVRAFRAATSDEGGPRMTVVDLR